MDRKDVFSIVTTAEVRAQTLYRALAKSFTNPETSALFNELVLLEQGHEKKVRSACKEEYPDFQIIANSNISKDLTGLDLTDPQEVLKFAISREEIARAQYLSFAMETTDPELKEMLQNFATEEDMHKTLLYTEMERIQGMLSWFDPSELNGLMED